MRNWIVVAIVCAGTPALAKGVGLLEMESCIYNGKRLNRGIAAPTDVETPSIDEDFSGRAVCYDIRKKKRSSEIEIRKGKRHGWETKFDLRSGSLAEKTFFRDGVMSGPRLRYDHRNGKLQREMEYRDGKVHGIQKEFYSQTGQLRRIFWTSDPRPDERTDIQFNEDGTLSSLRCGPQVLMEHDSRWCGRAGKRHKVALYGYSDGTSWPREIVHYKNNRMDGERIRLHRDGRTLSKEVYAKGESQSRETYADGKTISISETKKGKRSGVERVYFPNSDQLKLEVTWKNRKKASQKEYYEDGLPKTFYKFKNGKATITRFFGGKKHSEGQYRERGGHWWSYWVPVGTITYFHPNGQASEKAPYKAGEIDGKLKVFDSRGKLYREDHYAKGTLKSTAYYRGRTMVREVLYNADGSVLREVVKGETI